MKIAFIEPSIAVIEPLGIGYIAQCLIERGHKVKYFEAPRKNFFKRLKKFNPDVLAYSITTGKHKICRKINQILRKSKSINAISLFGGPHCTFFPNFIESSEFIDGVCIGEGELAFVELLDKIEKKQNYKNVKNWWLRINNKIYKNPIRNRIEDLDSLPFPNREIIYEENRSLRDSSIKWIIASRGCMFQCSYCFNKKYNELYEGKGKIYRQRSARGIVDEVLEIKKKYNVAFFRFVDDIFALNSEFRKEFSRLWKKKVNIDFICNQRPNVVTEEGIKDLKKAGCVAVTVAIESGNDFIRNKILNRKMSSNVINNAIKIIKREGLRIWTQNIICNPEETFEMVMDTYEINKKNKVDFAECFILTPYPGTEIYDYCVKKGYFRKSIESIQRSYWLDSQLHFENEKEKRRLVNFHKFFSFAVRYPVMLPLVKVLIKLPPNKFFIFFNKFHDFWRISRVFRVKFNIKGLVSTIRNSIKSISGYFVGTYNTSKLKREIIS
ncbi:MAG: B12-binding domain-containing radical SAM protein [Nanoarchaeota archaeon]|nr:B12-binding domain-containing radical SAM protein [Nanoarchaeota archaeon]